ncbi:MAG: glycine cleavage system aminomethyltransferase GcvT [Methylococcales bacterium]
MTLDHECHSVPLNALHHELGARMIPFAGYWMPLQYPAGILSEHQHTRNSAGFFELSHMGQIRISGPDVAAALENLVPSELSALPLLKQRYTFFTNDSGGVLDDLMVTNAGDHYFLVVNAARKQADLKHLIDRMPESCRIEMLSDRALIALQGPEAAKVMARLVPGSERLEFMQAGNFALESAACFITRCGYTGEDGFEISLPASEVDKIARLLLRQPEVAPIGLGARDTLRLEAGLCLYGHELDETTTPVEAGLSWVVARHYLQPGGPAAGFPGAARIFEQIRGGVARQRVGLLPEGRVPVREGAEILNDQDEVIGRVTSGSFGPSIGAPVAMAYLDTHYAAEGSLLGVLLRNKRIPVKVSGLPFVKHRYYSK